MLCECVPGCHTSAAWMPKLAGDVGVQTQRFPCREKNSNLYSTPN